MKYINVFAFFVLTIMFYSCEDGLAPRKSDEKSFLNGKIIFKNHLPKDSAEAIRAIAFTKIPDSNIIAEVMQGNAYFNFESLPIGVDTIDFSFEITKTPVDLPYIAAIMQTDTSIFSQRVIGVYTETGDKTKFSTLKIQKGKTYSIIINVDFNDLPPMPF